MPLTPGTTIGRYEIIGPLGVGGMGEVYRARDARIARDVALKILPDVFATDPERIARFQREAQVLGSLNHQNIAAIYGLEEVTAGGSAPPVLVMELVEGQTLAERIDAGPLPLDEALAIATQIAEALDAAHELGIIHRDLKPANVKLRPDGTVKVLDFGLAKISEPAGASQISASAATFSPTLSLAQSRAGMIVGTAAYMAPEQARGRPVDKRADVWAFGVVLYEMLTGQRAFLGEDVSDTLASVIKFEPDWSKLPADTPPVIRRLLKRCLTKDPKQRLRECGSALLDIREAQSGEPSDVASSAGGVTTRSRRSWLPLVAVAALAAAGGAGLWALLARPAPATAAPTRRFTITLPDGVYLPSSVGTLVSLARDGQTILYRAARDGKQQLYRRPIDQFDATVVSGIDLTTGDSIPSPDGKWIVFNTNRTLKKMPGDGGPVQTLAPLTSGMRGLSWLPDGNIVVGLNGLGDGMALVPMAGGAATQLFKSADDRKAVYPQVLRNGKAVLFTLATTGTSELVVWLDTSEQKRVLTDAAAGRVLPSGHLVFVRAGALWAVAFDQDRLEARGSPVPLIEGVRVESGGAVQFDVSDDGTLVFVPGAASSGDQRSLQLVAPDAKVTAVSATPYPFTGAKLSPDGTRIAVQIDQGDAADVWVVDVARGALTRLTREAGFDGAPVWSPDGRTVVFASTRGSQWSLHRKAADGTGNIEQLVTITPSNTGAVYPTAWTTDGQIVTTVSGDIGLVPADGKGEWKPLIQTPANESQAAISPDGRWIAYASNETGTADVYVQRFPDLGVRQPVSVGGGFMPTWSHDGRAVYYLRGGPPRDLMRVTIDPTRDGGLKIGAATKLVDWTFYAAQFAPRYYDVAADGGLVVIGRTGLEDATTLRRINVITNWFEELKRVVPVK